MKTVSNNQDLIAFCGLYCGACKKYLEKKCPGCKKNDNATWCKIRTCCDNKQINSCADCGLNNVDDCKKFNNFMSKIFAFIFKSDRRACIESIRKIGYFEFSKAMSSQGLISLKKK